MAAARPDYLTDANAVLKDTAKWRYGRAPDYSKTRSVYEKTKTVEHETGSLSELVQNLVKNWEIEASFKMDCKDWRTIDAERYSFAVNGLPPISAERFLELGSYNAIIMPNGLYSPEHSDFGSSHKAFKRMMPTFAWEVVEVYSGPPLVAFKWRHWGVMKNGYVGFNNKGEKVTAKAHGGPIEITGITTVVVNDQFRMQKVETYFDAMEMFRQIAPKGIISKQPRNATDTRSLAAQLDNDEIVVNVALVAQQQSAGATSSSETSVKTSDDVTVDGLKNMPSDLSVAFEKFSSQEPDGLDDSKVRSSSNSSWARLNSENGSTANSEGNFDASKTEEGSTTSVAADISPEDIKAVHAELNLAAVRECPFLRGGME